MKLLHVIASIDPAGGGPIEGVVRQNAACVAAGLDVVREVATLDPPDSPLIEAFPMKVHALGRPRTGSRLPWRRLQEHWGYAPDMIPWLLSKRGQYDIMIVEGLWNYSAFAASCVLPGGPTPYFVFAHGMMDPWFRQTYPLKHLAKQAFWLVGEGRLLAGARSVLFTCEEERRKARGQFWGHRPYRETVVGYGASVPPARTAALETAFRAAAPKLGDRPYLLFLSRIHPKKGCDLLIGAFAAIADDQPDLDLVMAGPDGVGWRAVLEAQGQTLGVTDRIHWTGPIYDDAKWGALYGADAFVLPSHQENFGIAVAEALGCGTPVLISNKVDIWREIETAGAGIVTADTIDGATEGLRAWLGKDANTRDAMRQSARALFQEQFDVAVSAPALIRTMESLV